MARSGRLAWGCGVGASLLGLILVALPARATMKFGALQLSGNFETQNLIRHPNVTDVQLVMNRNVFRLRMDWDWIKKGKFVGQYDVPFIKKSRFFLLYRGVYDGFYDLAPGGRQRGLTRFDDIVGGPIEGNKPGTFRPGCTSGGPECLREGLYGRIRSNGRHGLKLENRLREVYVDLSLSGLPLSFRIGRQQVIWGESDQFRLMDIWNPLDLSWHLVQEPFDRIRVPLWLIKGLLDTGTLGPLSNTFVELVYNPFDFQPGAKVSFLPRPWGAPIPDVTRDGQVQTDLRLPLLLAPKFDLQGTSVHKGDFNRNLEEAGEIGGRFHGVTRQGLEFTLNYIYARGRGIGAVAGTPFSLKIEEIRTRGRGNGVGQFIPVSDTADAPRVVGQFGGKDVMPLDVKAKFVHPYSHIFGLTGNYFDGDLTQAIFRIEMAYQLGAPVQTIALNKRVVVRDVDGKVVPDPGKSGCTEANTASCLHAPIGADKRNIWSGMIGFDRPTWIKFLNPRTTWFISGQFFWSYVDGSTLPLRGPIQSAGQSPYINRTKPLKNSAIRKDGVGTWTSGPFAGLTERLQDATADGNQDNMRPWELLATLAMTSFYRGGTIVPFFAFAYDPTNTNLLAQLQVQWFYTNEFVISLEERIFTDFGKGPSMDPWGVGGLNDRRDETGIKLTYQF